MACLAAFIGLMATQSKLQAGTITVTSTNDNGPGTLRNALANALSGDIISFTLPLPAVITLTNGELVVSNNLTIAGPGAPHLAISGNTNSRVFNIASNCIVSLSGLGIRNGRSDTNGGGLFNAGNLTLSNCLVAFNQAGAGGYHGGGVFNGGTMTVVGCSFRSNQAGTGSAGAAGGCGLCPIYSTPGSPGGNGGGIYNAGSLMVRSSTLSDNRGGTGGPGGAQYNGSTAGTGGIGGAGGGIYNAGDLVCVACTISDNHAGAGGGGGFALTFPSPGYGGVGGSGGNGGGIVNAGTATIHNTLLALNAVGLGGHGGVGGLNGPSGLPGLLPDVAGAFASLGHNLIGANNGSTGLTNGILGNIVGTTNTPINPRLGAFQDNGGPTGTMSPLTGSPLVDAGDDVLTGSDQRGFPRLSGAHVDIGAYEGVSALFSRGEALFVGGGGNNSIPAIEIRSGNLVGTFAQAGAGTTYQILGPRGMICFNNQLLVVNQNVDTPFNGEIVRFDLNTGAYIGKFVAGSNPNAPYAPRGMILGSNNVVCVADFGGFDGIHPGRIARYNSAGTYLGNASTTGLATPFYPMALVVGPDGLLYVSGVGDLSQGSQNGFIFRFQYNPATLNYQYLSTVVASTAANFYSPGLHSPEGIVFGPDGNIYITSFSASFLDNGGDPVFHRDAILVFSKNGQSIGSAIQLYAENESRVFAQSLLFGPRGDLFVPLTSGAGVRRYSASSGYQQFSIIPPGGISPTEPWYLTFRATNPRTLAYEPPKLTNAVSGNNFVLSWPETFIGWQLEGQTNSAATGLSNNWFALADSVVTNAITIPRAAAALSGFFRLQAP